MDNIYDSIEDGALQAYIEGERLPHVVEALAHSPELQRQLAFLTRANERLHQLAPQTIIPSEQDMVDVATGQATPLQQLRVAAYLRESVAGRARMAYLLEGTSLERSNPQPLFLATPPMMKAATKHIIEETLEEPVFVAAELAAQVVIRIQVITAHTWRLRGYVEQRGEPLVAVQITLRAANGRRRTRKTDTGGFFSFENLLAGSYHLRVVLDSGILLTPPINLGNEQ